jgi:hypothetical protein
MWLYVDELPETVELKGMNPTTGEVTTYVKFSGEDRKDEAYALYWALLSGHHGFQGWRF